jgi:hypothetical protein
MAEIKRVDVGFQGGQVLQLRLEESAYKSMRKALDKNEGWTDVKTEDSEVSIDVAEVVYVRLDTDDHRVGF